MKLIIKLYFPFLLLFSSSLSFGQNSQLSKDSLIHVLENTSDSKHKLELYINLAKNLVATDQNESIKYGELAIQLATQLGDKEKLAKAYNITASANVQLGNFTAAIDYNFTALDLYKSLHDIENEAILLNDIGVVYYNMMNIDKALEYFLQAFNMPVTNKNSKLYFQVANNIASVYTIKDELTTALEYYEISKSAQNISIEEEAIVSTNMAVIYFKNNDFEKAEKYFLESSYVFDSLNLPHKLSYVYENLAKMFIIQNKDLDIARNYALKGLEITLQNNLKTETKNLYQILARLEASLNNFREAYEYELKFAALNDSILNFDVQDKIAEVEAKYLFKEKEAKIKAAHDKEIAVAEERAIKRKYYLIFTFIIGFLTIAIGIFILRNQKQKNKLTQSHLKNAELNFRNEQLLKQSLENELHYKSKELTSFSLRIEQNNLFLRKLDEIISKIKTSTKENIGMELQELGKEIRINKNLEKDKIEFQKQFEGVHKDFIKTLKIKYPDLTSSELRLCAMLKINMTSSEISSLLGVSIDSIRKKRYRIHKKMNLPHGEKLAEFIISNT